MFTGLLLSLLQNKGEHISEPELAEYLASLLELHGSATNKEDKMAVVVAAEAGTTLERVLPEIIDADMFTGHVLGFMPAAIAEWAGLHSELLKCSYIVDVESQVLLKLDDEQTNFPVPHNFSQIMRSNSKIAATD